MMANGLKYALLGFANLLVLAFPCAGQNVPFDVRDASVNTERNSPLTNHFRFYAGAHAAAQVFRVTSPTYPIQEVVVRPIYVFAGYQISPHLAVQVGFLQSNPSRSGYNNAGVNAMGQIVTGQGYTDQYDVAIPMLLRYRIARRPIHRLHIDLLLGLTLESNHYQVEDIFIVGGVVKYQVYVNSRSNNFYLTGGLGAGYDITPRVEAMVEATANRNTTSLDSEYAKKIMPGVGVGLRYRFNIGKQHASLTARSFDQKRCPTEHHF